MARVSFGFGHAAQQQELHIVGAAQFGRKSDLAMNQEFAL
jgi:hypothetical protein